MIVGKVQHVSQLVLGDVVRTVRGACKPATNLPKTEAHEIARRMNRGLMPVVGGEGDFRQGYDAMTVVACDENEVVCHRPHIHIHDQHDVRWTTMTVSVETVRFNRDHGGAWFELLQAGPGRVKD